MASEDDLFDDLETYAIGDDPTEGSEAGEAVGGEDDANRLLRARARSVRELARIADLAAAEKARIDAWAEDRSVGERNRVVHLERLLEGWARAANAEDPRRKTINLPNGTLSLRGPQFSVEVTDPDGLRVWLWANRPDLLKIDPAPRTGDAKAEVLRYEKAAAAAKKAAEKGEPAPELPGGLRLGPVASDDEDTAWFSVVTAEGEAVPGLRLARPKRDGFTVR